MVEPAQIETDLLAFVRREVFAADAGVMVETDLILAGFDSSSLVNLMLFVEQTYGLWIPEREITAATFQNTRSLAAVVSRLLHERPASS